MPTPALEQESGLVIGRYQIDDRWDTILLERFAGRERELHIFQEFLDPTSPQRILFIDGPANIGKSTLLWQYRRTCKSAGIPHSYIDLREPKLGGQVEEIVRNSAELIGSPRMQPVIAKAEAMMAQNSDEFVLSRRKFQRAQTEADETVDSDAVVVFPPPSPTAHLTRRYDLTVEFLQTAKDIQDSKAGVLFLDSYESASRQTQDWLLQWPLMELQFMPHIRLKVVIAGGDKFDSEIDRSGLRAFQKTLHRRERRDVYQQLTLESLSEAERRAYLIQRLGLHLDEATLTAALRSTDNSHPLNLVLAGWFLNKMQNTGASTQNPQA